MAQIKPETEGDMLRVSVILEGDRLVQFEELKGLLGADSNSQAMRLIIHNLHDRVLKKSSATDIIIGS